MKWISILALCLACCPAISAMDLHSLESPAGPKSMGSSLSTAPDGTVYLSWLEAASEREDLWTLRFSRLEASAKRWSTPQTIARGENWFVNWADFPSVTPLSNEILMAVWFVENPSGDSSGHGAGYRAEYSLSEDRGATWRTPQATTGESAVTEFTTVLALHDNSRALVAWLDGRQRQGGGHHHGHDDGGAQALYAQTLLAHGPDQLVDARVCDCCQLSLVRVGQDALLAYRGRSIDEVRDIRLARWRNGTWEKPRSLHEDGWKIAACPVNGPRLSARGDDVLAVWFTAAEDNPRVWMKFSRDGAETFGEAQRVDLGRPQGRVDALFLADGTGVVTWLEANGRLANEKTGGIYLRRIAADGSLGEAKLVAASTTARASGFPRIAALGNGCILLSYTRDAESSTVATLLLDLN
jgi:hypothetical protein